MKGLIWVDNFSNCSKARRDSDGHNIYCKSRKNPCLYQFPCGESDKCELSGGSLTCTSNPKSRFYKPKILKILKKLIDKIKK